MVTIKPPAAASTLPVSPDLAPLPTCDIFRLMTPASHIGSAPYGAHAGQVNDGNDQAWPAFQRSRDPRGAAPAGSRPRCWRLAGALLRGGADTGYIERMSAENARVPTPPEGLRPAQMGIVLLGRPILGHAAVTLADLAERGLLQADEIADDWRLERPPRQSRPHQHSGLLPFEEALLEGLLHDAGKPLLFGRRPGTGCRMPASRRRGSGPAQACLAGCPQERSGRASAIRTSPVVQPDATIGRLDTGKVSCHPEALDPEPGDVSRSRPSSSPTMSNKYWLPMFCTRSHHRGPL